MIEKKVDWKKIRIVVVVACLGQGSEELRGSLCASYESESLLSLCYISCTARVECRVGNEEHHTKTYLRKLGSAISEMNSEMDSDIISEIISEIFSEIISKIALPSFCNKSRP